MCLSINTEDVSSTVRFASKFSKPIHTYSRFADMGGSLVVFGTAVAGLLLAVCEGRGIKLGLCADSKVICQCGSPDIKLKVQIPIEECTWFYRWKPYCKACEDYDEAALCSQFRNCLSCNPSREGGCTSCPLGRYGPNCKGVCQCENNGVCNPQTGTCQCFSGYSGPRCSHRDAVTCGAAPSIENGQVIGGVAGSVIAGTLVNYRCNRGFVLVGPSRRRCQDTGTWSGGESRCEYSCSVPKAGPGLKVNVKEFKTTATADNPNGVALVRRVKFSCGKGDILQGPQELNCLPTSQWNAAIPTCGSIKCPKPTIDKGQITPDMGSYSVGESITITCLAGMRLVGDSTLTCQSNATWDRQQPRCTVVTTALPSITCPSVTVPENGQIADPRASYRPGESLQISCKNGFLLSGSSQRICQANGIWSGDDAGCVRVVTCVDPGIPGNGIRESQQLQMERRARGGIRSRRRYGRRNFRVADPDRPTGSETDINVPDGQFLVSTRLTFKCESRFYKLVGSQHRECLTSGEWSGRQPTCIPVCGQKEGARMPNIINGKVTQLGEWPWQAFFAFRETDGGFRGRCGGTVISENWVVTAAHCVTFEDTSKPLPLKNLKIYLGKYHRDVNRDDEFVQVFMVSDLIVHPEYNPLVLDQDIALVRLSRKATLSDRVSPVCLSTSDAAGISFANDLISPGSSVTVTGWGVTENDSVAETLMQSQLNTISAKSCETKYAGTGLPLIVTTNMFCAGHDDATGDTCFGDSGGPAVAFSEKERRWYLVGVVSWGSPMKCAVPMQYSGFTKISNYLSFISQSSGI